MIAGVLAGAALLLVVAGAAKLADPSRTMGALQALGWPSSGLLVRLGAAGELILGAATLVIGGPALAMLVAASYLGFAFFVMAALGAKTPLGTCGCFARADTPPRPAHVAANVVLASAALAAAVTDAPALLDASWVAWITAATTAVLGFVAFTAERQPAR